MVTLLDQVPCQSAALCIESDGRFIEQQKSWGTEQCRGQHGPPLLAKGALADGTIHPSGQSQPLNRVAGGLSGSGPSGQGQDLPGESGWRNRKSIRHPAGHLFHCQRFPLRIESEDLR